MTTITKPLWYLIVILTVFAGLSIKSTPIKTEKQEVKLIYSWAVDDNMKAYGMLSDSCKVTNDYNYLLGKTIKNGLIEGWIAYKIDNGNNLYGWTCVYISPGIDSDSLYTAINLVTN